MSDYFIKTLVEKVLDSLDRKPAQHDITLPQYTVLPQLSAAHVKILVNSSPLANSRQFTEYWLKLPVTQHRIQSYDFHAVPGLNLTNVTVTGKVRFDESGRNKLNESADLVDSVSINNSGAAGVPRAIWGSWFGFTLILVVDATKTGNVQQECIHSLNYRITYIPKDSVIEV